MARLSTPRYDTPNRCHSNRTRRTAFFLVLLLLNLARRCLAQDLVAVVWDQVDVNIYYDSACGITFMHTMQNVDPFYVDDAAADAAEAGENTYRTEVIWEEDMIQDGSTGNTIEYGNGTVIDEDYEGVARGRHRKLGKLSCRDKKTCKKNNVCKIQCGYIKIKKQKKDRSRIRGRKLNEGEDHFDAEAATESMQKSLGRQLKRIILSKACQEEALCLCAVSSLTFEVSVSVNQAWGLNVDEEELSDIPDAMPTITEDEDPPTPPSNSNENDPAPGAPTLAPVAAPCCSYDHKNCIQREYCGTTQEECENCGERIMKWLPNGSITGLCGKRWSECSTDDDCCDGLSCRQRTSTTKTLRCLPVE